MSGPSVISCVFKQSEEHLGISKATHDLTRRRNAFVLATAPQQERSFQGRIGKSVSPARASKGGGMA